MLHCLHLHRRCALFAERDDSHNCVFLLEKMQTQTMALLCYSRELAALILVYEHALQYSGVRFISMLGRRRRTREESGIVELFSLIHSYTLFALFTTAQMQVLPSSRLLTA